MLRETAKLPGATSQTAHASVSMLKVNESTIRRRLGAGENLFFYKRQHSSGLQTTRLLEQCFLNT